MRILRLHLLEGQPISEICDSEGIHPTQFYQWQKTFFEKGIAAFEGGRSPPEFLVKASVKSKRWKASCAARMKSSPRSWKTWCGQKSNLGRVKGPVGTARCA